MKFPQNLAFEKNGQFRPDCGPEFCKLIFQDSL